MAVATMLDGICKFLGGNYDTTTRTYRSSPIAGVGVVRRAWAKRDDHNDYYHGMPPGTRTGSQIVVHIADQDEYQETLGPEGVAIKRVVYRVDLNVFVRSECEYAEDAQDDVYALRDAIVARLRSDRTMGGSAFQAAVAIQGGSDSIHVRYGQPVSNAELTKSFFTVSFSAVEFVNH